MSVLQVLENVGIVRSEYIRNQGWVFHHACGYVSRIDERGVTLLGALRRELDRMLHNALSGIEGPYAVRW